MMVKSACQITDHIQQLFNGVLDCMYQPECQDHRVTATHYTEVLTPNSANDVRPCCE